MHIYQMINYVNSYVTLFHFSAAVLHVLTFSCSKTTDANYEANSEAYKNPNSKTNRHAFYKFLGTFIVVLVQVKVERLMTTLATFPLNFPFM